MTQTDEDVGEDPMALSSFPPNLPQSKVILEQPILNAKQS